MDIPEGIVIELRGVKGEISDITRRDIVKDDYSVTLRKENGRGEILFGLTYDEISKAIAASETQKAKRKELNNLSGLKGKTVELCGHKGELLDVQWDGLARWDGLDGEYMVKLLEDGKEREIRGLPYADIANAVVDSRKPAIKLKRSEILHAAEKCICGKREQDYGTVEDNFGKIAELWTAYKGIKISPLDVAMMMALLKIARIEAGTATEDSFVDGCGYIACGGEIAHKEV